MTNEELIDHLISMAAERREVAIDKECVDEPRVELLRRLEHAKRVRR